MDEDEDAGAILVLSLLSSTSLFIVTWRCFKRVVAVV